jgi:hypothetical protein
MSAGFHIGMLIFIFVFELYNILRRKSNYIQTVALGAFIFIITSSIGKIVVETLSPIIENVYFQTLDDPLKGISIQAFVVIGALAANYYYKLSAVSRFVTFSLSMYFIFSIQFSKYSVLLSRSNQICRSIAAIVIFEIVMKQPKVVIVFLIGLPVLRKFLLPESEMFALMIPKYRDLFYGVFYILFM